MRTRSSSRRAPALGAATLVLLACGTPAGGAAGAAGATAELELTAAADPVPSTVPASPSAPLEALLPDDVFVFLSFAGLEASSRAAEELGLWRLWREPDTQAVFAGLIEQYAAVAGGAPPDVQQHWAMIERHLSGRVSLALGGLNLLWTEDGPIPMPGVVLSLDTGAGTQELRGLFDHLVSELPAEGGDVRHSVRTMAGREVDVVSGCEDVLFDLHVAFLPDRVLVGLGPYLIGRCLENLNGTNGAGGTLAASTPFRRARGKAAGEPLLEAWIDVDAFASRVRGLVPEEVLAECRDLGLADIGGIYYASAVKDGDSFDTFYVDAPAPRRGLLALADGEGLSREALGVVPDTAALFTATRWDFAGTWDVVWGSLESFLPTVHFAELESELAAAERELGFSIRDGLLAALGDELVLYAELPQHGLVPNVVASIGVRDRAAFESVLARLLGMSGADVSELDYRGHPIRVVHVEGAPFAPALSVDGSRALVSLSVPGLKAALTRDPSRSIVASEAFRATFAQMDWERATAIDWFDAPRVVAFGYNLLENMGPAALGGDAPVDLARLPDQGTVLAHFRGWGSVARADEDGLVEHSRSVSVASLLALGSRFLMEAPGVPPYALERLFGGGHGRKVSLGSSPDPYAEEGRRRAARERVEELTASIEDSPSDASLYMQRGSAHHGAGEYLAAADDFLLAKRLGAKGGTASYNAACCLSLAGMTDEALAEIEAALDAGFELRALLHHDADLDNVRTDPRFGELLGRLE